VLFARFSAAFLLLSPGIVFGQTHGSREACGDPVAGIALCLSRSVGADAVLEIRNTAPNDTVLNLGIMLANGGRQYPTSIALVLTDAEGKEHHGKLDEPAGVASRVDPLVVPLPSDASLKLPVELSRCLWYASGQLENFAFDPKQPYTLRARLTGRRVSPADEPNLDMKGIALMPYWTGAVVSNTIALNPR
jgi:hypothetical protein